MPKPGLSAYGPAFPHPKIRTMTSFGLMRCGTSGPSPNFSIPPARKLSTTTSASGSSASCLLRSLSDLRSRHTLFLFRPWTFHHSDLPSFFQSRKVSPCALSILITSAPKSASWRVSMLPATKRDKSRTRTPSKGRFVEMLMFYHSRWS